MPNQYHEENRRAWNAATVAHNSHKIDQAGFLAAGGSTLFDDEIALLGELSGKSLLHLQCNAGQDTLSLAHLGATVTGVDISDAAIDFARDLSAASGIPAEFYRADVYDWLADARQQGRQFDVAYSSYGFLPWLSDLAAWAAGIAGILRPGGRLVLIEFHPLAMMFDEQWRLSSPYFRGDPLTYESGIGDYVAMSGPALAPSGYQEGVVDFRNPYRSHEFPWSLSDLLQAVIDAGLNLRVVREYPYSNGARLFDRMVELPGNRFASPADLPALPMMFGVVAVRP